MSIIGWNCRRLGNPRKVPVLKRQILKSRPNFIFLFETKLLVRELAYVARAMGFDSYLWIDCLTNRDGQVKSYSQNHIDAIIHDSESEGDWRFTGMYGWPDDQNKWKTWRMLDFLATGNTLPWCCMGDFNEILFDYEKRGGLPHRACRMEAF
ncbi:hypothetical protein ACS0TY_008223 [Phlomoides rotata]